MSDPKDDPKDVEILPKEAPASEAAPLPAVPAGPPAKVDEALPTTLIALPLNQRPVFPSMMLPLAVPAGRLAEAVRTAIAHHRGFVGFFLTKEPIEDGSTYTAENLSPVGCLARISKHNDLDNGAIQVFAQVQARFRIDQVVAHQPAVLVQGEVQRSTVDAADPQVRSCAMAIVSALKELVVHNPVFADEIKLVLANFNNLDGPGRLADMAASLTTSTREDLQTIVETIPVIPRMEKVLLLLAKETQIAALKSKIQGQINERVSDNQRKFFLNEQLKSIKQELGIETDDKSLELKRLTEAFEKKRSGMTAEAVQVVGDELRKLTLLEPSSSEYGVTRSRLEWLVELPWGVRSEDVLDLAALRRGLDQDHFGLEDVKERITEFVAVRKLKPEKQGGIIALVGPPGTGKTSVGASIAKQLGRKFYRFSLGGMRDEAEIKGHRRTYVGAIPGKPVQALKRCGTMNPVIMLDEIDKLSHGLQGDPASALLEVLDPEQNKDFLDHYLDIRVDLSQVLFICTANELGGIPEPLRDRMEIIRLSGYVEVEKLAIARDHLVPKVREAHGLTRKDLTFTQPALRQMIRDYAREAGVRHLEQLIAKVSRKVALAKAGPVTEAVAAAESSSAKPVDAAPAAKRGAKAVGAKAVGAKAVAAKPATKPLVITPEDLPAYLGKPLMRDDELLSARIPGVVTGLAWTALGGATLEMEAVCVSGEPSAEASGTSGSGSGSSSSTSSARGGLTLTGQLGDVMKESASLARSYLTAHGSRLGIPDRWFDTHHVHLHVPAGATPKDGPSAGITMATALLSLALGRPVARNLGMTGELTLTGRVYPIGGVREKLVAAKRSGLTTVLLPHANERDYAELPELVRDGIAVRFVRHLDEVLVAAGLATADGGSDALLKSTPRRKGATPAAARRPIRRR